MKLYFFFFIWATSLCKKKMVNAFFFPFLFLNYSVKCKCPRAQDPSPIKDKFAIGGKNEKTSELPNARTTQYYVLLPEPF